jgi:hypothetical protein
MCNDFEHIWIVRKIVEKPLLVPPPSPLGGEGRGEEATALVMNFLFI